MTELPLISVIVPCRDEEPFLAACIESLLDGHYPASRLEIIIVDGRSRDRTKQIAERFAVTNPRVCVLDNPSGDIPAGMNIGLRAATGDFIAKSDAHAEYPRDYFPEAVRLLTQTNADAVGGVLVTKPKEDTAVGRAIALVLSHPLGSGDSHFRIGVSEPRWVDTVVFPVYRRSVFDRVGGYNEALIRSSDIDLHGRIRAAGGKLLISPTLSAVYYSRAQLGDFFQRNLLDGFWALYPIAAGGQGIRLRHTIPAFCVFAGLAGVVAATASSPAMWAMTGVGFLYVALITGASLATIPTAGASTSARMPAAFIVRHVGYGVGSVWGLLRALVERTRPHRSAGQTA